MLCRPGSYLPPLLCYLLLLSPTLSSAAEDNIWQGPALPCACPLPPPASATRVPRSTDSVSLFNIFSYFFQLFFIIFFYFFTLCLYICFIFPTVSFLMSWKSACRLVLLKWRPTEICFNILSGSFFLFQRDHNKLFEQMISSVVWQVQKPKIKGSSNWTYFHKLKMSAFQVLGKTNGR